MTVANQTSPPKRNQPQNHVVATEKPPGNETGNEPVLFLICSKKCLTDIQISEQHVTTTPTGDITTPPPTTTTPLTEEGLVRDEQTNEVYLPLTSTVVLKRKQEMLYLPRDFDEKPNSRSPGGLGSICQCNRPERLGHKERESPEYYSQNRQSSQFSDTSSQWPVRKTISNNHT